MAPLVNWSMSSNLPVLETLITPLMSINFIRHPMDLKASRAWYDHITTFLREKRFEIGLIDSTLFKKRVKGQLFISQMYVDYIIFGSTNYAWKLSFKILWPMSLLCLWWESWSYVLDFMSSNWEEGLPSTKPNISKTCSRVSICLPFSPFYFLSFLCFSLRFSFGFLFLSLLSFSLRFHQVSLFLEPFGCIFSFVSMRCAY